MAVLSLEQRAWTQVSVPELIDAAEQLEAARQEWHSMLAENPIIRMELHRRQEEARQQL